MLGDEAFKAIAVVNADGTVSKAWNFGPIVHTGVGTYTIDTSRQKFLAGRTHLSPTARSSAVNTEVRAVQSSPDLIDVTTFVAGVAADNLGWSLMAERIPDDLLPNP